MRASTLPARDSTMDGLIPLDLTDAWDFASSRQVMAIHARTSFHFATRFLPPEKRRAAIDLYAFFRSLDDLVDENVEARSAAELREILEVWKAWAGDSRTTTPQPYLASGVERAIRIHAVPRTVFGDFVEGLMADLEPRQIANARELDTYCYQVASTVGIAMAHVLGNAAPAAIDSAARLAAAMQRTNILRDVGEDLAMDRMYIPRTLLAQYGLTFETLRATQTRGDQPPRAFRALMQAEIGAARSLYDQALPGIWLLPPDSRFPILLAARLYRHLLTVIERNRYDSIHQRAATSGWDKTREFAICTALVRLDRVSGPSQSHA